MENGTTGHTNPFSFLIQQPYPNMTETQYRTDHADPEEICLAQSGSEQRQRIVAYYDKARRDYWIKDARDQWVSINEKSLSRHLKQEGISAKCPEGEYLSDLDKRLNEIQFSHGVDYVGPLAGHSTGITEVGEHRVLVTSGPSSFNRSRGVSHPCNCSGKSFLGWSI
jgi:hypothetical protein